MLVRFRRRLKIAPHKLQRGPDPCTGMKVAKLEIKIILAFMLAGFESDIVDKFGKRATSEARQE